MFWLVFLLDFEAFQSTILKKLWTIFVEVTVISDYREKKDVLKYTIKGEFSVRIACFNFTCYTNYINEPLRTYPKCRTLSTIGS